LSLTRAAVLTAAIVAELVPDSPLEGNGSELLIPRDVSSGSRLSAELKRITVGAAVSFEQSSAWANQ
jgi:hypothetical protein